VEAIVETRIFERHGERDLRHTRRMPPAAGDRYKERIEAGKAADAEYR
jgi:hypothetical protein